MEKLINALIGRYENGGMSRRELVGTLAALSVTGGNALAAPAGFASANINHVSITCSNLQRTAEYYERVFQLKRVGNQGPNLVSLGLPTGHLAIRKGDKVGFDHFAIGIERFNKDTAIADLKARGATPLGNGTRVEDPDGLSIQLIEAKSGSA